MNSDLNYIIEANIGLLLFLALYKLLLHRETNFTLLRMLLLTGVIVSLCFPLIHIENSGEVSALSIGNVIPSYWLPEVVIGATSIKETHEASFNFWKYASLLYVAGLMLCSLIVLWQLAQLFRIIYRSRTYRLQALRIAESREDKPTFSFFNFIFIGKAHELSPGEKQQIIRHESVHARRWHSFDILLMNLLKVLFWFNPFISTYKKIFIQLHEFEADARAVENSDVNKYCSLLAKVALQSADFTLANHFNNSLTVKRIEMMRTIKNKVRPWKIAVIVFAVPLSFYLIACHDQVGGERGEALQAENKVFTIVEAAASFEGGLPALMEHLQKNMVYPSNARKQGVTGTVHIQFVVNEEGNLTDVTVLKGIHPDLDTEAVRAVKALPSWKPGKQNGVAVKQRYVLPISFNPDFPDRQDEKMSNSPYSMEVKYQTTKINEKTIVEGTVLSKETQKPLPGTNIIIAGTSTGITADANGKFRIEVPAGDGQLVFSYVGYDFEKVEF